MIKKIFILSAVITGIYVNKETDNMVASVFIAGIVLCMPLLVRRLLINIKRRRYRKSSIGKIDRMSGEEFELYMQEYFRNKNYSVKHVGKTGDFGADLILKNQKGKTAVQAKRYNAKVGVKAVQEVISAKTYYKCEYAMVVTNSYFTKQAKELAEKADVTLWDRDDLSRATKYLQSRL